jgi:hypothetical protein
MNLAKQLSVIPNVESTSGWSRSDKDSGIEISLPRENGAAYRLNLTPDTLSGIFNKYGEAIPTGNHRRGIWGVKEEGGQKILYLCGNASDARPGSLWFVSAPALLSPERIKSLGIGVTIQIFDDGRRSSYAVQGGTIGDCVEGNDRGEYRQAAEKFLTEHWSR